MTFNELEEKVHLWALDKGLITKDNTKQQALKTVEEVGELCKAILDDNKDEFIDAVGDVMVTLIILARQNGLSALTCLQAAWDEIRDREGETVEGIFKKKEKAKKAYLIQHKDKLLNLGLFDTRDKAVKYAAGNNNLAIVEMEIG